MGISQQIEGDIQRLNHEIARWVIHSTIPRSYFRQPEAAHAAVPDGSGYALLQHELASEAVFMTVHEDQNGYPVTRVRKTGAYLLAGLGKIHWLEVRGTGKDLAGPTVEAISFYVDDLGQAETVLRVKERNITYLADGLSLRIRGSSGRVIFTDVGMSYEAQEDVHKDGVKTVRL